MDPLFIYPEYEVVRDYDRCISCRVCERQCANEVHRFDERANRMLADSTRVRLPDARSENREIGRYL